MSFSEDPSSPAAPFSGDGSGQIFDLPDFVAGSPETSERIVDTQSGFLVIVKKPNDMLALSVKRHVGTPPGSSVPLTPDESLKLSKILASSFSLSEDWNSVTSGSKDRRSGRERRRAAAFAGLSSGQASTAYLCGPDADARLAVHEPLPVKFMLSSVMRTFMVPVLGIALSVFVLGICAGITALKLADNTKSAGAAGLEAQRNMQNGLGSKRVDSFVRDFVSKMLDFTARTYRVSQVQAMAAMSPDLLERYWQETKFPLSKRQLSGLPQGTNIVITELKQERPDPSTVSVDVHAQIRNAANPNNNASVDLRLKLALDSNNQIIVIEQQDLSSAGSKK